VPEISKPWKKAAIHERFYRIRQIGNLILLCQARYKKKEIGEPLNARCQSTLIAPHVELPHSWMNFSMEKRPVRSSTNLPYKARRPVRLVSACGISGDPSDVIKISNRTVQYLKK
jgi:hypothetical protein